MKHSVLCFGEILWDLLPSGPQLGGAPMNVAYHLHQLGHNPALVTRIGDDQWGRKIVRQMEHWQMTMDYLQTDPEHGTGIVHARPDERGDVQYEIAWPVAWDFIEWDEQISSLASAAQFLVFGSLSSRSGDSRDTISRLLDSHSIKVLDINLRPPHFQRTHLEFLMLHTQILKLNLPELELIAGWFGKFSDREEMTRVLQDRFRLDTIVVTMGERGAFVNQQGVMYRHAGYPVQVADTIGSGDAFLAGLLHALLKSRDVHFALDIAAALGALVAGYSGACPAYTKTDIDKFLNRPAIRGTP